MTSFGIRVRLRKLRVSVNARELHARLALTRAGFEISVLAQSKERIEQSLADTARVLDVGGWAHPWWRADWVIDLMPYETRGLYGEPDPEPERFTNDSWVTRDICARERWPFADDEFDYVVCSHTLEDIRDPIWACSELIRVAKAGYIEVPARVEEQTKGVHGDWVGWSHHHWLIDIEGDHIQFVLKPHLLHGRPEFCVARSYTDSLTAEDRVSTLFWEGHFSFRERIFFVPDELHAYLAEPVQESGGEAPANRPEAGGWHFRRLRDSIRRAVGDR